MFTNKTTLHEFLGGNSTGRPVEYFFHDLQRTFDETDMEMVQIGLLVFTDIIYGERSTKREEKDVLDLIRGYARKNSKESSISVHQLPQIIEEIFENEYDKSYNKSFKMMKDEGNASLEKAIDQFNKYRTLVCAEKQQKAFERQLEINGKIPPSILPNLSEEDLDKFCEELYAAKVNCDFGGLKKETYFAGYKKLYAACKVQPIAAAFLPVILTIFSTDEKLFQNIYSYFKYKNRRLTAEAQDRVIKLFTRISESTNKWVPCLETFQLPVFRWNRIEDAFCKHKGLSSEESEIAKQYFEQYRNKNGLSKSQEGKLGKLPYGADLRALANLCNLNTYLMVNYLPEECIPRKTRKSIQELLNGNLLPGILPHEKDIYHDYFAGRHVRISCNPEFCYLALLRYYHIASSFDTYFVRLDNRHEFFPVMKSNVRDISRRYCVQIQRTYEGDPNEISVSCISSDDPPWLQERIGARWKYEEKVAEQRRSDFKKTTGFIEKILCNFNKEDYLDFIGNVKNFQIYYFSRYLNSFCERHEISDYADADATEKCHLEDIAFPVVLQSARRILLDNFKEYWYKKIAEELFRKD